MLQVASVVAHHFGVCRHHQLHVARVGEEALASVGWFGVCVGGVVAVDASVVYDGSERFKLLSHGPSALDHNWPLRFIC